MDYKNIFMNSCVLETQNYIEQDDGSLMVRGVPVLAVGRWTSMEGIQIDVTDDILMRCSADPWPTNGIWTRHAGGTPRSATDKVGSVRDPHFDAERHAIVADLVLHRKTEESRNVADIIRIPDEDGGIKSVSAEMQIACGPDGGLTDIIFTGLAFCDQGACKTCKLPNFEKQEEKVTMAKEKEDPPAEGGNEGHPWAESKEKELFEILLKGMESLGRGDIRKDFEEAAGIDDEVEFARCCGRLSAKLEIPDAVGSEKTEEIVSASANDAEVVTLRAELRRLESKLNEATVSLSKMIVPAPTAPPATNKTGEDWRIPMNSKSLSLGWRGI